MINIQTCTKCGIEKGCDGFHKNKTKKSGYASACKVCSAEDKRLRKAKKDAANGTSPVQQSHEEMKKQRRIQLQKINEARQSRLRTKPKVEKPPVKKDRFLIPPSRKTEEMRRQFHNPEMHY